MLRFCGTIGTLTSRVWVRLAVRWAAGWPPGHFRYTLVKVSWSIVGSQQLLLTRVQVFGAIVLLFGPWLAVRWMVSVLAVVELLAACVIYGPA